MKILNGKNWFEFQLTKHNGFYIGPLYMEDKNVNGRYRYKTISFITRRFKFRFIEDREDKKWEFSFGGLWSNEGSINQYISYEIKVSEFENKSN